MMTQRDPYQKVDVWEQVNLLGNALVLTASLVMVLKRLYGTK